MKNQLNIYTPLHIRQTKPCNKEFKTVAKYVPAKNEQISSIPYNYFNLSFKAHPEYEKLSKDYPIKASSYFRRGGFYGSPSEKFEDIIRVFSEIFDNSDKKTVKMLIGGIGDSQEPFSYLAVIKDLTKPQKLKKTVDLYTIDLQPKPTGKNIAENSYFDHQWEPDYAKSSFVYDERDTGRFLNCRYKVTDEIFDFLYKTYNSKKSQWDTSIQDYMKNYPTASFDVISMNNVIPYIRDRNKIEATLKNIHRTLKPNGIFITDPLKYSYFETSSVRNNFIEIASGIYKKTNN